jgi:hypothetical protein
MNDNIAALPARPAAVAAFPQSLLGLELRRARLENLILQLERRERALVAELHARMAAAHQARAGA